MVIAIIILSTLLFLSLIFIVVLGLDDGWHGDEWLATFLFIFVLPVWLIAKLIVTIKGKLEDRKIRIRRKELNKTEDK